MRMVSISTCNPHFRSKSIVTTVNKEVMGRMPVRRSKIEGSIHFRIFRVTLKIIARFGKKIYYQLPKAADFEEILKKCQKN